MGKVKRTWFFIISLILTVIYFLATDPDSGFITDLSFGTELVIVIQAFLLTFVGTSVILFLLTMFIDDGKRNGDETYLIENASREPIGSGLIYLGNSLRLIAYAIIFAVSLSSIL